MNTGTLILRSLRFYWRTNLGVLLGAALACAILTGALAVGDSVKFTLRQFALLRLGRTEFALTSPDHFVRAKLADELASELKTAVAPAFVLRGSASVPDGRARANDVQIVGVDERFWQLGATSNLLANAATDEVIVNARLAEQLGVRAGDEVIARMEPPSLISRDAPLSGKSDTMIALRLRVRGIADDVQFGRFSLQANQVPPMTVFVPLARLQSELKHAGEANTLLVGAVTNANEALRKRWTLADAGLEIRGLAGETELRSERVFLDPAAASAAFAISSNATGVLTYFANEIRRGERATPYSFVAAKDWRGAALDIADNEIVINEWLADDLGAKRDDELTLRYFVIGERRELRETNAMFHVAAVIPTANDPSWMPEFPGLADEDNCREWAPGIPIDTEKIRPKDEEYWNKFRGTPKAFVTLAAGQKLWSNRFGNLTAIRFPAGTEISKPLMDRLDPAALGLSFVPVRERALAAGSQSLDFGQLFIGFSFFLIVAALLLTAMLFVFNLEQRREEVGLLRAIGFRPKQVRRFMLVEGAAIAVAGSAIGTGLGVIYTRATLHGLSTVWRGAVGASQFVYRAEPATLVTGFFSSVIAAVLAMWLAQRGPFRKSPIALLAGQCDGGDAVTPYATKRRHSIIAAGCFIGAVAMAVFGRGAKGEEAAGIFFTAGMLVLIAGMMLMRGWLGRLAVTQRLARTVGAVGIRNIARRPGRSVTTAAVLASGVFLVIAVNAFHQDPRQDAMSRTSGTGGFALFAQSASPVYDDLNTSAGCEVFGIAEDAMKGVSVVPMRVRDGDEASCLNLNRAQQPRIFGVHADELAQRKAFAFAHGNWSLLDRAEADGAIPAIGDEPTVTWALGKKLGDTVAMKDDAGREVKIRIVGVIGSSILQGGLLVSERNFVSKFSSSGFRAFLIDAPVGRVDLVDKAMTQGLQDRGFEVAPAWRRLADFMAVENTYLGIFQALGGLGLLLGSAGLGIVVLRNVAERRGELALLRAVGFEKRALHGMVFGEHALLVALGLVIGVTAAVVAILPALQSPGVHLPVRLLALVVAGLGVGGIAWSWLASAVALRGPLIESLRNE